MRNPLRFGLVALVLTVSLLVGCVGAKLATDIPPAAPSVSPDLQTKADQLAAMAEALRGKVRAQLQAEAVALETLAKTHKVDVREQRKRVDEMLAVYDQLAQDYVAFQEEAAAALAQHKEQVVEAAKFETILKISGLVFAIVLIGVVWFGPVPQAFKAPLMAGLIGALVFGVIGLVLQRFARPIVIGAIVLGVLVVVGLVVYIIFGEKLKKWAGQLKHYTQAMGETIAEQPNAEELARRTAQKGTPGLGAVLEEAGVKVDISKPPAVTSP